MHVQLGDKLEKEQAKGAMVAEIAQGEMRCKKEPTESIAYLLNISGLLYIAQPLTVLTSELY
jgi:hypothetical protein